MAIRNIIQRLLEEARADESAPQPEDVEVRLAIYDSPLAAPRVVSVTADDLERLIGDLAAQAYTSSHERGGRIPFVVIREVVENLIHAYFRNAVISILDGGNTIRIADQGPGIRDKQQALQPGFTTATREMRRYIRGVGSGLPVAKEQLGFLGGTIAIEDNLTRGTVVTIALQPETSVRPTSPPTRRPKPDLSSRQKKVLLLISELGAAGPKALARDLDISHSTAYRELQVLKGLNLVRDKGNGKRTLTEEGIAFLEEIFTS